MTAYSNIIFPTAFGSFVIEIRTVNRRFLETDVILPRIFSKWEEAVRKKVCSVVSRGKVKIIIKVNFENESPLKISPNLALVNQLNDVYKQIGKEIGREDEAFDIEFFLRENNVLQYEEEPSKFEEYFKEFDAALSDTLKNLIEMKEREGEALEKDIFLRLNNIEKRLKGIEKKAENVTEHYRNRLQKVLEGLLPGNVENEDRVIREVALIADRADITEEITRSYSHIKQFNTYLKSGEHAVGKTIEFLLQEMLREANTIGSKAIDTEISHSVVEIKSELEKIREQVQNVE